MGNVLNLFGIFRNTVVNIWPSLNMDVNVAIISLIQSLCKVKKMCIPCHASCKTSLRVLYQTINI